MSRSITNGELSVFHISSLKNSYKDLSIEV
jgi:hypothetical protein